MFTAIFSGNVCTQLTGPTSQCEPGFTTRKISDVGCPSGGPRSLSTNSLLMPRACTQQSVHEGRSVQHVGKEDYLRGAAPLTSAVYRTGIRRA